jgi:sugar lactone lactonase YvrE
MVLFSTALFAQHSLEKLWETDSTTLTNPESVLYDEKSNSLYVSNMGAGTVVRFDLNGKLIRNNCVTGLSSNKGSSFYKGLFYTAETTAIAVIDLTKGTVIRRIPVPGAIMLNDVAIDSKGVVYVTDTRAGKVYRIENEKPELFLDNRPGANGLLFVGSDLYVLTSSAVEKVSADKQVTKVADGFESGLDAIVIVGKNEFIVSNYKGMLYYLNANGTKQVLLDTRARGIGANDIGYSDKTKTLYVPSYGTNRIIAYKVN